MTRVLILFSSSQLGGAERSLSRMVFASSQTEYVLGTLDKEGPWCSWARDNGFDPLVYGESPTTLHLLRKLRQDINRLGIDVVYVCGIRASLLARLLLVSLPAVALVHGIRWNPDSDDRLDSTFRRMERVSHRLVDAYITNSAVARHTLASMCRIPAEKISVIYNGLSAADDFPQAPSDRREVLTVANLKAGKGHLDYLQAIARISTEVPDTRFIFVGKDELKGEVEKAIDEMGLNSIVQCVGFQEDVSIWYRRASVFVLPSCAEGCPTSILEAMNHSLPTVAFAIDGIPELIESGRHGILVSDHDFDAMANAIVALLTDDERAKKLGAEANERVKREFRLSVMSEQHARLFSELSSR